MKLYSIIAAKTNYVLIDNMQWGNRDFHTGMKMGIEQANYIVNKLGSEYQIVQVSGFEEVK